MSRISEAIERSIETGESVSVVGDDGSVWYLSIPKPERDIAGELRASLVALIELVKRTGGYMSPEDQRTLWEAECAAKVRL